MAVARHERVTFQALVTVYLRYHLQDYFEGTGREEALGCDVSKIWVAAHRDFPGLAHAFSRFNQTSLFESTVLSLLSTLLTQAYCPAMQPFEYHVRLLDYFLLPVGEYVPEDPRAQLRQLVLCIMAKHESAFLQCESEAELHAIAEDLKQFVRVDNVLLQMLNRKDQIPQIPQGTLWPSALMAGLGAVVGHIW